LEKIERWGSGTKYSLNPPGYFQVSPKEQAYRQADDDKTADGE
jgi:hypothetical protein